jgi:hypothetical protein
MAVLGFAQEVFLLVRVFALPKSEGAYKIGVLLAPRVAYWCRLLALPVAGVGLVCRRRWAWWLAVGCCVASVGLTIVSCFDQILAGDWLRASIAAKLAGRVLQPYFSMVLLVLLLLPSTRAAFPRPNETPNADSPGAPAVGLPDQVRAMGCLILLMAAQFAASGVAFAWISMT